MADVRPGPRRRSSSRRALKARLKNRFNEVERAILAQVNSIAGSNGNEDPVFVDGQRRAIVAAIEYSLDVIAGDDPPPSVPVELLAQVRRAARTGIGFDTVLRRYSSGYALLLEFLVEEIEQGEEFSASELTLLLRAQSELFYPLLSTLSEEYVREERARMNTAPRSNSALVEKLLAGEPIGPAKASYDFGAHHLGIVAVGQGAPKLLRELAGGIDRRLLLSGRDEETVWAWLGGRNPFEPRDIDAVCSLFAEGLIFAIGEPASSLAGWRLTHRQALAALPVALRTRSSVVRYADVSLLAAALRDELLAESLRQRYLAPLEEGGRGKVFRETLRAYFASERNASSTAASLGVNRNTIANRLRIIEERLGPLSHCASELDTALRLDQLGTA